MGFALAAAAVGSTSAFTPSTSANKVGAKRMESFVLKNEGSVVDTSATALALSGGSAVAEESSSNIFETLQIGTYFALWYLFNIGYNIYNKQALNVLDFPWTVATIQMATGILYFVPMWLLGLRKAPKLSLDDIKT